MGENMDHSIEEGFKNLEDILTNMESSDIGLEDSFKLYKAGMEELAYCAGKIDETKKAVMAIAKDGSLGVFEEAE